MLESIYVFYKFCSENLIQNAFYISWKVYSRNFITKILYQKSFSGNSKKIDMKYFLNR